MPVLECPVCGLPIIGQYQDLLKHVLKDHEMGDLTGEDGDTLVQQIRDARDEYLKHRINDEMVVDEE